MYFIYISSGFCLFSSSGTDENHQIILTNGYVHAIIQHCRNGVKLAHVLCGCCCMHRVDPSHKCMNGSIIVIHVSRSLCCSSAVLLTCIPHDASCNKGWYYANTKTNNITVWQQREELIKLHGFQPREPAHYRIFFCQFSHRGGWKASQPPKYMSNSLQKMIFPSYVLFNTSITCSFFS